MKSLPVVLISLGVTSAVCLTVYFIAIVEDTPDQATHPAAQIAGPNLGNPTSPHTGPSTSAAKPTIGTRNTASTQVIAGNILTVDGRPAVGATVRLIDPDTPQRKNLKVGQTGELTTLETVKTDAHGNYEFRTVTRDTVRTQPAATPRNYQVMAELGDEVGMLSFASELRPDGSTSLTYTTDMRLERLTQTTAATGQH